MAIDSPSTNRTLNTKFARTAGTVSILLSLVGVAGLIAYWLGHEGQPASSATLQLIAAGAFAIAAAAGVQLIRGSDRAQKMLLGFWLFIGASSAVLMLASVMYDVQTWWKLFMEVDFRLTIACLFGGSILTTVLLVTASVSGSRQRYGSMVAMSIAAAIAVVLAVNIIAQTDPIRLDVQTLGQFGLSARSREVVRSLDADIRLTCIYTADNDLTRTKYRPRTLEYLNEMRETVRQFSQSCQVENVTTDAQKTALVARLKDKLATGSSKHLDELRSYQAQAGPIADKLNVEADQWSKISPKAYLAMWGISQKTTEYLKQMAAAVSRLNDKITADLSDPGTLPDTQTLLSQSIDSFDAGADVLRTITKQIDQVGQIAKNVALNREQALAGLDDLLATSARMAHVAGEIGDPIPDKPSEVLNNFVPVASETAQKAAETAARLQSIAGAQNVALLKQSPPWQIAIQDGTGQLRRTNHSDMMAMFAREIAQIKADAESLAVAAKEEHIAKVLPRWRADIAQARANLELADKKIRQAIDELTNVDPASQAIFDKIEAGKLFTYIAEPMGKWQAKARELPPLTQTNLSFNITEDNIVIVEIGGKAKIVPFDIIWPLKIPSTSPGQDTESVGRNFNGDAAIVSAMMSMTREPFATVVLTYFKPQVPQQMARYVPMGMTPDIFKALKKQLADSNFEIAEWNLTDPAPPEPTEGRQQVLLLLPPAPAIPSPQIPIPQFGRAQIERVRSAINDRGTPAIFLAHFIPPQQFAQNRPPISLPYSYGLYLQEDWGIYVMSDHLVMVFDKDKNQPGKFKFSAPKNQYMRLSYFTDHPVGKPLQAQRMLWRLMCPITIPVDEQDNPKMPPGVTYTPLLQVPATRDDIWATRRFQDLFQERYASADFLVEPKYGEGDVDSPFDIAAAATQIGNDSRKPTRIVVLPMAVSLLDGYLDAKVDTGGAEAEGERLSSAPPRANADVVINSVYWLSGHERYISRGPVRIRPVRILPANTMAILRWSATLGVPGIILVIGSIVMLMRKR